MEKEEEEELKRRWGRQQYEGGKLLDGLIRRIIKHKFEMQVAKSEYKIKTRD